MVGCRDGGGGFDSGGCGVFFWVNSTRLWRVWLCDGVAILNMRYWMKTQKTENGKRRKRKRPNDVFRLEGKTLDLLSKFIFCVIGINSPNAFSGCFLGLKTENYVLKGYLKEPSIFLFPLINKRCNNGRPISCRFFWRLFIAKRNY